MGVFWQEGPILWVHSQASQSKIVVSYPQAMITLLLKVQKVCLQTFGKEPDCIVTPLSHHQIDWLQNNNNDWAIFLSSTQSNFDNHYPPNNYVNFLKMHPLVLPKILVLQPIPQGRVVFTNGSSHGIAAVVSYPIVKRAKVDTRSAQVTEVQAIIMALQLFPEEPLNVYTDSQYVAQAVHPLEMVAYIAPLSKIHAHLLQVQGLLWQRDKPVFVGHLRTHTPLPRPLSEGN